MTSNNVFYRVYQYFNRWWIEMFCIRVSSIKQTLIACQKYTCQFFLFFLIYRSNNEMATETINKIQKVWIVDYKLSEKYTQTNKQKMIHIPNGFCHFRKIDSNFVVVSNQSENRMPWIKTPNIIVLFVIIGNWKYSVYELFEMEMSKATTTILAFMTQTVFSSCQKL